MASESDLNRYRANASRVHSEIAKTTSSVAAKRKKAADARAAAQRSKNASTIRQKTAEADRAEGEANAAEKKRGDLEKKLADLETKTAKAQIDVDKKRAADQKKAMDAIWRQNASAASQFTPATFGVEVAARPWSASTTDSFAASPTYDVFLSHASEDKDSIARPLKDTLEARGLSVWFDEIKIKVGQSIRQEIEKGIANARFGVVVISPDFFRKHWTRAELDALFSRKMESGRNLILPIWHHVSKDEVLAQSPLLAGILALNSALMTVDEMAQAILEVIHD
ncbi:toll/interleukin-1 receptor domain-containing protein [Phytoactinopolyspora halophila]|uniref:toll/interleukin-1 receptor domain-containing protein n=1 Tax=Phytoactinopolyspora halophila TaxID=1981511 RepID=UPI001314811C|nr:toll/interleukin-1 receptor domain-containing protein [Phytoactinopolyspora halophila]